MKIAKEGIRVRSLARNISAIEGHARTQRWGLQRMTSRSIIHTNLHKPNNKFFSAWLEHFWCTNEPRAYTDSRDSPQVKFGGSHHLHPYSIFCDQSRGLHPNVILSQDSQVGNPEILKIRTLGILEGHNFFIRPPIEVRFKENLQPSSRALQ